MTNVHTRQPILNFGQIWQQGTRTRIRVDEFFTIDRRAILIGWNLGDNKIVRITTRYQLPKVDDATLSLEDFLTRNGWSLIVSKKPMDTGAHCSSCQQYFFYSELNSKELICYSCVLANLSLVT